MATIAEPRSRPALATPRFERWFAWLATVDHKRIGILYLVTTGFFLLVGGVESLVMRVQLAVPNNHVLSPDEYDALFTMHGTTMIFLAVTPMLVGFANYFVPLQIGARDMAFPRLNALSYWFLLLGGLLLYFSFLVGSPPDTGWFSYAPLTERPYATSPAVDYWIVGITVVSLGSIVGAINILVTVLKMRAPGMSFTRIPLFTWTSILNTLIIIFAMPDLTAAQLMLLADRHLGAHFFDVSAGADPLLWQHLFWYFGHPEVYIMILPVFGVLSEIVSTFAGRRIFGYFGLVGSGIGIVVLSFGVWVHHMFTTGLGHWVVTAFGIAGMLIAIPTGIKIFNWLATMWGGRIRFTTPMLFALGFIVTFTIGGVTGVQFSIVPVDWQLTDTYFVVAHFHYVLVGGSYLAVLAAIYFWFPKMSGRLFDEGLGKWHFWSTMIGLNLTFFPMHVIGLMGMPRRVYTYPDRPWWGAINFAETVGAFILGGSVLFFLWNIVASLRHGQAAGDNPWDAATLEWATSSPPPAYNFATIPPVPIRSPQPLWSLDAPDRADAGDGDRFDGIATPVLATYVFIASEVIFFGALIVAFIAYRTRSASGPTPDDLDVPRTALFSLALFASSATVAVAGRKLRAGKRRGFQLWLLATIVLGVVFLFGQATEYRRMYAEHITIDRNLFTSAFFTATGFHGLHVTIGVLALSVLAWLGFTGGVGPHKRTAVEAVSIYWHFVDAVWVVLFSTIYLWAWLS
jgi:cytochrome c oxidase subunit 1/cytochrome c oxidase subunit I+III